MKPRFRLRSVTPAAPITWVNPATDKRSQAERLADAIAYLKQRNLYVLQHGGKRPSWGVPGTPRK